MQVKDYPIVVKVFDDNDSNEFKITMPKEIYDELITDYQTILKVGKKQRNIDCCSNDTKNIFELSDKMLSYFGLCKDKITNLIVKENVICLGPVIGIFVSNGSVKHANIQNPNFRLIETMNCNKISNSIVYYFSVKDVDFEKEMIRGTYLNELTGRWEKKEFPYPDVFYDRGGGTLKSQLEISDSINEYCSNCPKIILYLVFLHKPRFLNTSSESTHVKSFFASVNFFIITFIISPHA